MMNEGQKEKINLINYLIRGEFHLHCAAGNLGEGKKRKIQIQTFVSLITIHTIPATVVIYFSCTSNDTFHT